MTTTAQLSDREILDGIAEVAREHLDWQGPVTPELRLVEELKLDSVRLLTLAMEIENRFEVYLVETGIETVADLIAAVKKAATEDRSVAQGEPADG